MSFFNYSDLDCTDTQETIAFIVVVDTVSSPEAIPIFPLSTRRPFVFQVSIPVAHKYALEIADGYFFFQNT